MDIEILATSAVEESLSQTDVLKPYITKNDKEPSWDGNVYIHSGNEKSKKGLKRVPTQVKGKISDNLISETIYYPIEIEDLHNYLDDSGVIYFVVYISEDGTKRQIYYVDLLPVRIRKILEESKENKKTASVLLNQFPTENNEKVSIFLTFHSNREKQASFVHAELYCENDIVDKSKIESRFLNVVGYNVKKENPFGFLFNGELYSYLKLKDNPIPLPIKETTKVESINRREAASIKINGIEYYKHKDVSYGKDYGKVLFGNCLYFIKYKNGQSETGIEIKPNLESAVNDLKFVLDLFKYRNVEIDGEIYEANKGYEIDPVLIENYEKNLDYCINTEKVFDAFSLNKKYDLSKMSDQDKRINAMLIQSVVYKEPIKLGKIERPLIRKIEFANSKIIVFFKPAEKEKSYLLQDYFLADVNVYVEILMAKKS